VAAPSQGLGRLITVRPRWRPRRGPPPPPRPAAAKASPRPVAGPEPLKTRLLPFPPTRPATHLPLLLPPVWTPAPLPAPGGPPDAHDGDFHAGESHGQPRTVCGRRSAGVGRGAGRGAARRKAREGGRPAPGLTRAAAPPSQGAPKGQAEPRYTGDFLMFSYKVREGAGAARRRPRRRAAIAAASRAAGGDARAPLRRPDSAAVTAAGRARPRPRRAPLTPARRARANPQVALCPREDNHDWARCPYAHAKEKARRRDPARCRYTSMPCPHTMQVRGAAPGHGAAAPHDAGAAAREGGDMVAAGADGPPRPVRPARHRIGAPPAPRLLPSPLPCLPSPAPTPPPPPPGRRLPPRRRLPLQPQRPGVLAAPRPLPHPDVQERRPLHACAVLLCTQVRQGTAPRARPPGLRSRRGGGACP
jgi:hypothetical protein